MFEFPLYRRTKKIWNALLFWKLSIRADFLKQSINFRFFQFGSCCWGYFNIKKKSAYGIDRLNFACLRIWFVRPMYFWNLFDFIKLSFFAAVSQHNIIQIVRFNFVVISDIAIYYSFGNFLHRFIICFVPSAMNGWASSCFFSIFFATSI